MRNFIFALLLIVASTLFTIGALVGLDLYLHKRYERSAGLNHRGYRGPIVSKKQDDEVRLVMLGGSTTFGYGVHYWETLPFYLEKVLNGKSGAKYTVVNLGMNNHGAYSFPFTLKAYEKLDYDMAILYEGYNDLSVYGMNKYNERYRSPVFRMFGYSPILPLVFREKAMSIRYKGNIDKAYRKGGADAERINFFEQMSAVGLETIADATEKVTLQDKQNHELTKEEHKRAYEKEWGGYLSNIKISLDYLISKNKKVFVVGQPKNSNPIHLDQQVALKKMIETEYPNKGVAYLNMADTIDLKDPDLSFDQMHLTAIGNHILAEKLGSEMLPVLQGSAPAISR